VTRNLLLSGGTGHPFEQTSVLLAGVIGAAGIESDVEDDLVTGIGRLERPSAYVMVTVNALRWRMLAERYAPLRPGNALSLPEASRAVLQAFVGGGGSLLAVHTACICFDDWPGWGDIVGAAWDWDRSCHPPLGPVHVTIRGGAHPLVDGVTDFDTVDEAYGFLDERDDIETLATIPCYGPGGTGGAASYIAVSATTSAATGTRPTAGSWRRPSRGSCRAKRRRQ